MPSGPFRLSVCNESSRRLPFAAACRSIEKAGWDGIEIAPFTLLTDATRLPKDRRAELRNIIVEEGLDFVGLHWLTVGPEGLHVTTPDAAVRRRSWEYVRGLVELARRRPAGVDSGGVMVFGSPGQRKTTGGATREQATRNYVEGVRSIVADLEDAGVTLLIEALPAEQCDVIQTLDEAAGLAAEIASPNVQTDVRLPQRDRRDRSARRDRRPKLGQDSPHPRQRGSARIVPASRLAATTSNRSCKWPRTAASRAGSRWKSSTLRPARKRSSTTPSPICGTRSPG